MAARPEVTGRKGATASTTAAPFYQASGPPPSEKLAYSIAEFCALHDISKAHYYKLKKKGLAPRAMDVAGRKIISREAAADWRREREAESKPTQDGD